MRRAAFLAMLLVSIGCRPATPCPFQRCDTRALECQSALAATAACLREREPLAPSVEVISQDDFVASQVAAAQTATGRARAVFENAALALLNLAPENLAPEEAAAQRALTVPAFYRSSTKTITVVDTGRPLDSIDSCITFIHESTHALQDQAVGIAALTGAKATSFDSRLAIGALIEGEAVLVQDLATLSYFGVSETQPDWSKVYRSWADDATLTDVNSALPLQLAARYLPYPYGTQRLHADWERGGWDQVDLNYQSPPLSTREYLTTPEELASTGGHEDLGADAVPTLGAGFETVDVDEVGAWMLSVFLFRAGGSSLGSEAASKLTGDQLSLHRRKTDGAVVVSWRLRLADDAVATRVSGHLSTLDRWNLWRLGRDVVLMASTDKALQASFNSSLPFHAKP